MLLADDDELVLTLDLEPGTNADALVAAESLIAWVAAIREANAVMDPDSVVEVGLISADIGSLKLRTALRFVETTVLGKPSDLLNEFPRIKKIVVATVIGLPLGVGLAAGTVLIAPTPTANLSPEAIKLLEKKTAEVNDSADVKDKVVTFYKTVSRDKSVTNISVSESKDAPPIVSVPRAQFPERTGLWDHQEVGTHERPKRAVWDVVLVHPAMKSAPLSWGFERDGLPFNARLEDAAFLAAISDGTLPIPFKEGVHLQVEIEWREQLIGDVWEPMPRSRKITKVLSPRPTLSKN